ncbi:MAG: polysaccharide deacetylase family protein [Firmicutes bacterium]|nr:polysaccharide deacetylase family protein [Bacillota bacterium]
MKAIFILLRRNNLRKLFIFMIICVFLLLLLIVRLGDRNVPATAEPLYHGNESKKEIALSCNVFGGEEYIGPMLEILTEKQVKMTFFIGGTWAKKFPELVKKIQSQGHEIGSHGYAHPHPDRISRSANYNDIIKAERILKDITGQKPVLYAPPYGERGGVVLQVANELGYRTILWSIDTIDWQGPSPQVIKERVLNKAHNGGIVLMHPTASTVAALPGIIDTLQERGYKLVPVGAMAREK